MVFWLLFYHFDCLPNLPSSNEAASNIEQLATKLTKSFRFYAGAFLSEKCNLSYREEKRRLVRKGDY